MQLTPRKHVLHGNMNVRMRDSTLKLLDVQRGEKVLDIGCGLGYFLLKLKGSGAELHGLDPSEESIEYVKKNITEHAKVGSVEEIPYPDNMFDKVLFCEVIEHVEDDEKVLREIRRILKPGGRLVVSTPSLKGWRAHSKLKQLGHHHGGEFHYRDGYYPRELEEKLVKSGYRIVKTKQAMFLLSELMMELTKVIFLRKKRQFEAQSDLLAAQKSLSYKILRLMLTMFIPICKLEDMLMIPIFKRGHALMVSAEKV